MMKRTLTFGQVMQVAGPRVFATMAKPLGSACNLNCTYCYYLEKAGLYGGREPKMPDDLLELYIKQHIEACETENVDFCWHGGEPLMLGIPYFQKIIDLQRKWACGKTIGNSLQTNGTLVDEAWCDFFAANGFLVGLSLDGPQDIHDAARKDRGGRGSFDRAWHASRLFIDHGVEFNTLSVVSTHSEGRGLETYRFLRDVAGSRFMQFLPAADFLPDGTKAPWSVSAEGYGRFLCDIFDEWVRRDVGSVFVQIFDATLAGHCRVTPGVCTLSDSCGGSLCVEHNGDVYACDHFVDEEHLLGNIKETTLAKLYDSPERQRFALSKLSSLPGQCRCCQWLPICHGECPGHRTPDGVNALCDGLRMFFAHTERPMQKMRKLLLEERAPAEIMKHI